MTIKELIAALSEYDEDSEVWYDALDNNYPVTKIEEYKKKVILS